jgi:ATP adenylyltransferase
LKKAVMPSNVVHFGPLFDFIVHMASSLEQKHKEAELNKNKKSTGNSPENPFLPYEKEVFVADLSQTHVCLLNKFNVFEHHLLMVTSSFEHQETLLNLPDFEAVWICMAEFEGLAFYNGGKTAGASQTHKHLQMIPLPITAGGPAIPINPVIEASGISQKPGTVAAFPFSHALADITFTKGTSSTKQAKLTLKLYWEMLRFTGMNQNPQKEARQSGPYNLIITRNWMLLIPRTTEFFQGISINALGFAGSLLVRNKRQMEEIKSHGPMKVLRETAL